MIAKGFPSRARHSTVMLVELNGPNQVSAAGSLAAAARLRPTETVSRRSSSLTSTSRPALPGQIRVAAAILGRGGRVAAAETLGAGRYDRAGAGPEQPRHGDRKGAP